MWRLTNDTKYAGGRVWGRDKEGVHEWIVVVKGTFDILSDGKLVRAEKQVEPLLVAESNGEDGKSSLRYEADLVGPKPTTDILLNGTAYAPKGRPATEFLVSLRVADVYKQIKVVGDRTWKRGLLGNGPSGAAPVVRVPIAYERAYGGFDQSDPDPIRQRLDTRNPVGCGLITREGSPVPNFEYPAASMEKAGPAGFGPLASYWSPRREWQGTYDDVWKKGRFPLLPADWDPRSLLCAPADQRPAQHLRGGELVELENLTPDGKLSFRLPKMYFGFRTIIDNRLERHSGRLVTVIIEPDYPRVILVWQSVLAVRNEVDYLDETTVTEKQYRGSQAFDG
ncbi:hypothetical protein AWB79_04308 [Caballeronia hypogeia]|uniref:DUF2169 domain-containing protein n=1 Tax=Caballeronia hypogeia TaxID=1777140 RepID=A0A158BVA4_9BURK|nr:DUF2169 domain-containing protein [Caballeronia hypogeia]SAK74028.1 hypothetical protein AWB79_04308 [Caballeronia hypogeia]